MAQHREVVEKKTNTIIVNFLTILMCFIIISDLLKAILGGMPFYKVVKFVLYCIAGVIFILERRRAKTKYKYLIIQDELIIHKIVGQDESLMESINLKDIEYLGKCNRIKDILNIYKGRKYNFSFLNKRNYVCIYNTNKGIKRFYFKPSDKFLNIVKKYSGYKKSFSEQN